MKLKTKDTYEGEWKNDIFIFGKIIYCNKNEYKGSTINGIKEGKGIMLFSNSEIYDGEWKNDMKDGKGLFNDSLGNEYNGE